MYLVFLSFPFISLNFLALHVLPFMVFLLVVVDGCHVLIQCGARSVANLQSTFFLFGIQLLNQNHFQTSACTPLSVTSSCFSWAWSIYEPMHYFSLSYVLYSLTSVSLEEEKMSQKAGQELSAFLLSLFS